jgi:hypothetical protein
MFFIFKTKANFGPTLLDSQSLGSFFIHDTGVFENKICLFGKFISIIAIGLACLRLVFIGKKEHVIKGTIVFDIICILLAATMNTNALIYIIPLIITELIIIISLT